MHTEKKKGKINIAYGEFVQFTLKSKQIYLMGIVLKGSSLSLSSNAPIDAVN